MSTPSGLSSNIAGLGHNTDTGPAGVHKVARPASTITALAPPRPACLSASLQPSDPGFDSVGRCTTLRCEQAPSITSSGGLFQDCPERCVTVTAVTLWHLTLLDSLQIELSEMSTDAVGTAVVKALGC